MLHFQRPLLLFLSALFLLPGCTPLPHRSPAPATDESAGIPTTAVTQPQDPSLLDFLQIALQPVGNTMYVWGGGWNEEDTGAGTEAVTLGVSPRWAEFAALQTAQYDYNTTRYQIHDGLDCSGYVGWAVYNTLENESGKPGYVCSSTQMAQSLADRNFGTLIPPEERTAVIPGDVMSMKGHVWIAVGSCDDGSVLLLHASPPGVSFCGTTLPDGGTSEAVRLAESIMSAHYPQWFSRYPNCSRPHSYLTKSSTMRWQILEDPQGLREMSAHEVAALLFPSQPQA